MVGPRELLAGDEWLAEVRRIERPASVVAVIAPTWSADVGAGGPRMAIEVELASKSSAAAAGDPRVTRAMGRRRQARAVIYICATERGRRPGHRWARSVGLVIRAHDAARRAPDTIRCAAITARRSDPGDPREGPPDGEEEVMLTLAVGPIDLAVTLILGAGGGRRWWLRRHSSLSVRNLYIPAALSVCSWAGRWRRWWPGVLVLLPLSAPWMGAVTAGRRWRAADLGAGGELRNHELARRWIWQPRPRRGAGRAAVSRGQGEIVHDRPWPERVAYVSMTARRENGPRLPLGEGQHVFLVGATGSGKTTTARRLIAARVLAQQRLAAGARSEGRSRGRRADAAAGGRRRRAVRAV